MSETFRRPCPECGAIVESRYGRSADGLSELPWIFEVRQSADHEPNCTHFRSELQSEKAPLETSDHLAQVVALASWVGESGPVATGAFLSGFVAGLEHARKWHAINFEKLETWPAVGEPVLLWSAFGYHVAGPFRLSWRSNRDFKYWIAIEPPEQEVRSDSGELAR